MPAALPTVLALLVLLMVLVCVPGILMWRVFRRHRFRERAAAGQCLRCGYDLRASVDRCPECGLAIAPAGPDPLMVAATATLADEFAEDAQEAIASAHAEARRLLSRQVEPQHLLLGILRQASGPGAQVLHAMGVETQTVRLAVERTSRAEVSPHSRLLLEPSATTVFAVYFAHKEREQRHGRRLDSAHLLLGVLALPAMGLGRLLSPVDPRAIAERARRILDERMAGVTDARDGGEAVGAQPQPPSGAAPHA